MYKVSFVTFWDTLETVYEGSSFSDCIHFLARSISDSCVISFDPDDKEFIVSFSYIQGGDIDA